MINTDWHDANVSDVLFVANEILHSSTNLRRRNDETNRFVDISRNSCVVENTKSDNERENNYIDSVPFVAYHPYNSLIQRISFEINIATYDADDGGKWHRHNAFAAQR